MALNPNYRPRSPREMTERAVVTRFDFLRRNALANMWLDPIMGTEQSNQPKGETISVLGSSPRMTERDGDGRVSQLQEWPLHVVAKTYEAAFELDRLTLENMKGDQFENRLAMLAEEPTYHLAELASSVMQNGASTTCFTGASFYSSDHGADFNNADNLLASSPTAPAAPTADEMTDIIFEAIQAIVGFKDDEGHLLNHNASDFLVAVPAHFLGAVQKAFKQSNPNGLAGASNVIQQGDFNIRFKVNPLLTGNNVWTFCSDGAAPALIYNEVETPHLDILGPDSEYFKQHRAARYMVAGTYEVHPGSPFKTTLTVLS